MGTAERRYKIMKLLSRRRYETTGNLALEFGVSERTIQRDIAALSHSFPLYTKAGKYDGGVYVIDNYIPDRMYMKEEELFVLQKLYSSSEKDASLLSPYEKGLLHSLISQYTKPTTSKGRKP